MPASIELQIARQYNGVINCILNSKSDPKSFDTSLINLKTIIKISDNDYYKFFTLALDNNRLDIIVVLFKIMNIYQKYGTIYDNIFMTACKYKSKYLNNILNCDWFHLIDWVCIHKILTKKINYGLISNGDYNLTEYRRQDLYLNLNLKSSQEKIINHKNGHRIILNMEKKFEIPQSLVDYWYSVNKQLIEIKKIKQKRIAAGWTLVFFFCKYVKPGIHDWLWQPGGFKCRKIEKDWIQ